MRSLHSEREPPGSRGIPAWTLGSDGALQRANREVELWQTDPLTIASTDMPILNDLAALVRRAGYATLEKALWLHFAAQRPDTPAWARAAIYSALGYLVLPLDAVPDVAPGGLTDDAGVLAAAVGAVAFYIDDDVKGKAATKLRDWFGDAPGAAEAS